jgi:adenylate cyclase
MPSLRQIRLATGLVLYVYVTLHFANHALGNISVDAMESGLAIQKLIWQSLAGATILYASLLTHMSLGFWALYERRRFRWTRLEATQLVVGLSIPFLLTNHVIGTRVALSQFGLEEGYAQVLANLLAFAPLLGALQAILLLVVWIHGCLGVHFWLRLKPFYPRVKEPLLSIAVLLPALALLGYYQGGQRTLLSVQDPAWLARNFSPEHDGTPAQNAVLLDERTRTLAFLAAALAATLSARASDIGGSAASARSG